VVIGAGQLLFREGLDIRRHALSLASNGDLGWIQVLNFVVTGVLVVAAGIGLRSALGADGGTWVGRLLAVYGVSLVGAGVFRADPALGFPPGTPEGAGPISWHGLLHLSVAGVGFLCFIAACILMGRYFSRTGQRRWAIYSRLTGVVFLAAVLGIASGSAGPTTLAFYGGVLVSWIWLTVVCQKFLQNAR
jgi:hypothetical membrane protein